MNHLARISLLTAAVSSLVLSACTGGSSPATETQGHSEPSETTTNRIEISPTVRSNLGITFARVERRKVDATIRVPGAFELQPLARREYRMTLPGHIELAVDQYDRVEAGDLLYRYRSPEWPELQHEIIVGEQEIEAAQAAIGVAESKITETERHLAITRERLASLNQAQIRNAELETQAAELEAALPRLLAELGQTRTTLRNAERTREHALHRASSATGIEEHELIAPVEHDVGTLPAYRTIEWIEVHASHPGIVEKLEQTDGSFADAPSLVLSVVDMSMIRFRAMALQSDLARLGMSPEARIVPPSIPGIDPGDGVAADVTIGLEAHPEQRTVTLLATPEESREWIRPGVSAFLEVVVESTSAPALAIPRAAIVKDGITHVFFRRDPKDPNKAIRVEADMGVEDGRWVAINSGLMLSDEVVLDGAYELKLATQQSGVQQKGGHFHADGSFHGEED